MKPYGNHKAKDSEQLACRHVNLMSLHLDSEFPRGKWMAHRARLFAPFGAASRVESPVWTGLCGWTSKNRLDSYVNKKEPGASFGTSHPDLRLGGFSGFKPPEHIHISH
jgi:hypothetical protein